MKKIANVLPLSRASALLKDLVQTVAQLRNPESGCPWDLEQDFNSLRKYMLEEAYEASAAMSANDAEDLCDELGDVLLQVVLNAQIASETNIFTLSDVIDNLNKKMIRRHPHVFADVSAKNTDEVLDNWQKIKDKESKGKSQTDKVKIKPTFPALIESVAIGKETNKRSFDWENAQQVLEKVKEEVTELEAALQSKKEDHIQEELGDLLFSTAQLSRHLKLDPEVTLQNANIKFMNRFKKLLEICEQKKVSLDKISLEQKEEIWAQVKKQEPNTEA